MTHYAAATVPIMRDATVLVFDEGSGSKPKELTLSAFALISSLTAQDHLWLMMGSTNAAVALGAYRHGATVHQLSHARATSVNGAVAETKQEDEAPSLAHTGTKISAQDVYGVATSSPHIFYSMYPRQGEVLELIGAWQALSDAMEARKAYANLTRARMQQQAIVSGKVFGRAINSSQELADFIESQVGKDPENVNVRAFRDREAEALKELEKTSRSSGLYQTVFEPIDGVGPRLAARFIVGIERIERFPTAEHLMRYAGMMPTRDGKLPSKKRGGLVSRSPLLNNACFLLQDHMFQYGAKTPFGRIIHNYVEQECPCTAEERKADKDLRARYGAAIKYGRIKMSRAFLRQIWQDWCAYAA